MAEHRFSIVLNYQWFTLLFYQVKTMPLWWGLAAIPKIVFLAITLIHKGVKIFRFLAKFLIENYQKRSKSKKLNVTILICFCNFSILRFYPGFLVLPEATINDVTPNFPYQNQQSSFQEDNQILICFVQLGSSYVITCHKFKV